MENNFLIESYNLESLVFTKPKKTGDFLVCKIKYPEFEGFKLQFPKMKIVSETPSLKNVELEFTSDAGYNKKIYNYLSKLDELTLAHIVKNSEEWFGKTIPHENIHQMYNKFIKAPKTSENRCTLNFSFSKSKIILDKKNEPVDFEDLKQGSNIEIIAQLKYLIFSKDTAFVNWEINTVKLYKNKILRVPKFGFIEDPDDCTVQESDEEIEINSFY
jgi:hypothetical protein